ncbi:hypothetical protein LDENG_00081310 [Lucifuga dentata]|nr:hypothetical protein LDENG_00081310 [Lucifuga dentata]
MEDMNKVTDAVGAGFQGSVWIGLRDNVREDWKWSLSDDSFYGDGEDQFRKWRSGEPNNYHSTEWCTAINIGAWNDASCSYTFPLVCYDRTRNQEAKTWTDAQSYCRKHHTDLASMRNESENQEIQGVVPGYLMAWNGLYRNAWERWSDGSNSSFRYWEDGKPDKGLYIQLCAASNVDPVNRGKWDDRKCEKQLPFICYSPIKSEQIVKIKLKTLDSINPNDPAVADAILKQIEKKMKDEGINSDFKIKWIKRPDREIFYKEENDKNKDSSIFLY